MTREKFYGIVYNNRISEFKSLINVESFMVNSEMKAILRDGFEKGRFMIAKYLIENHYLDKDEFCDITELSFTNTVVDLGGIEILSNIEILNIVDVNIDNIINIKHLQNLKILKLINDNIENIDFIKYLTNLKHLSLNDNNIKNIEPLQYLKKLNLLFICGNKIKSYKVLSEMRDLKNIAIDSKNTYREYKGIEKMKKLVCINLENFNNKRNTAKTSNESILEFQYNINKSLRKDKIKSIKYEI